jgi:ethanolamine utilization protein EutQ (cupin superfamily)
MFPLLSMVFIENSEVIIMQLVTKVVKAHRSRSKKNEFPDAISPRSIGESGYFVRKSNEMDQQIILLQGRPNLIELKFRIADSMRFPDL